MKKNIHCTMCGKLIVEKNEIGMCKKLLGRQIERFFCMPCLADYLETTPEALIEKIEEFKAQGCTLFS